MKCHSVGLDEITPENILTIDLDGKVVAGTSRRHSEVYIHSEIFKARPDVHCVLHTHPTYSIAWSGTGQPLKPLSQPRRKPLLPSSKGLHRHIRCGQRVKVWLARKPPMDIVSLSAPGSSPCHRGRCCRAKAAMSSRCV
jgi:hypothetical protein